LGIVHADAPARDSLALDVMEAARPAVDEYVLRLFQSRVFRRRDFFDLPNGACRVMPPARDTLASTGPVWRSTVGPHVERVAALLAIEAGSPAPTLLTGSKRRQGRPEGSKMRTPRPALPLMRKAVCADCGCEIAPTRRRCPECGSAANLTRLAAHRAEIRTEIKESGLDPSHGPEARRRTKSTQDRHWQLRRRWEAAGGKPADETAFQIEIQPLLAGVSLRRLARETGLSQTYCAQIRRGDRVPHPRHWLAFRLAGQPG
ncbi:MAG: CRISPR-associated endonuclease Cas1, partial [Mycobacteriales bacterium]